MLECLVALIVYAIVAVIIVYVVEALLALFVPMPPKLFVLIRLLAAVLVLVALLHCLGLVSGFPGRWR